jgi:hypothetical protein
MNHVMFLLRNYSPHPTRYMISSELHVMADKALQDLVPPTSSVLCLLHSHCTLDSMTFLWSLHQTFGIFLSLLPAMISQVCLYKWSFLYYSHQNRPEMCPSFLVRHSLCWSWQTSSCFQIQQSSSSQLLC